MVGKFINPDGVVRVEGYEHAFAMCEGKEGESAALETQKDEYHMWMDNGVLYMVNYGHLDDTEVFQLKQAANIRCAQLR